MFQHGRPDSAEGLALRARMLEYFYPARREWLVMAAYQSNAMLVEALCGLSALELPGTDRRAGGLSGASPLAM